MKKLTLLLLLSFVTSCAAPKPCIQYIECPDGEADCRAQAHDLCPKGYTPVNEADLGAGFSAFASEHFPGAASGVPHLVVTCVP